MVLTENEYISGTIIDKATSPYSDYIEAQGKCYHRTLEHTRPIHLNLPQTAAKCPAKPPKPSHIKKPNPTFKTFPQPKKSTPPPIHILQCPAAISQTPTFLPAYTLTKHKPCLLPHMCQTTPTTSHIPQQLFP